MKTQRARPVSVMRRAKVQPPYLFDAVAFRRRITAVMAARDLSLRASADEIICFARICVMVALSPLRRSTFAFIQQTGRLALRLRPRR